jgi:hypothetical protein
LLEFLLASDCGGVTAAIAWARFAEVALSSVVMSCFLLQLSLVGLEALAHLARLLMNRLLIVMADFCRRSGMRVKLEKTVATAFDFLRRQDLSTEGVLYQGAPLVHLPAGESFPYLGPVGCGPASWVAPPPPARGAANGEQDPRHTVTSRQRRLTSSLPPRSWWGSQSTTTSYWLRWFLPCRWWRQLTSATQRLLCRGQMRSWTGYIRSGSKYTDLCGA